MRGRRRWRGSAHLANLTSLDLQNNGIGAEGAAALAGSHYLANLTDLDLRDNELSGLGKQNLLQRFGSAVSL